MAITRPDPARECNCAPYQPGAVLMPRTLHRPDCDADYSLFAYWQARRGGAGHVEAMSVATNLDAN
jgi:hypothetical protein